LRAAINESRFFGGDDKFIPLPPCCSNEYPMEYDKQGDAIIKEEESG